MVEQLQALGAAGWVSIGTFIAICTADTDVFDNVCGTCTACTGPHKRADLMQNEGSRVGEGDARQIPRYPAVIEDQMVMRLVLVLQPPHTSSESAEKQKPLYNMLYSFI